MRIVVLLVLLFIVGSLASGFYFVISDKGKTKRAVKALTIRVGLSVALFMALMLGLHFGILPNRHL